MVEYLVKRIIFISLISAGLYYLVLQLQTTLKSFSTLLLSNDLLEHRFSYTSSEIYDIFDELGIDNLRFYLIYQAVDLIYQFIIALFLMDLLTLFLRDYPSLAGLDILPFVNYFVNFCENAVLFYIAISWPLEKSFAVRLASMVTSLRIILFNVICALIVIGVVLYGIRKTFYTAPPPKNIPKAKKE